MTENRLNELNDIREIMAFRKGRRFMWRMLENAGIYKSSFALENAIMAFNEGQRNIGLMLLADIMEAAPEKYNLMMKEQKEYENERRINEQHERRNQLDNEQ